MQPATDAKVAAGLAAIAATIAPALETDANESRPFDDMDGFGDDPPLPFADGAFEAQLDDSFAAAAKEFASVFRDEGAVDAFSKSAEENAASQNPDDPAEWIRRAGENADKDKG